MDVRFSPDKEGFKELSSEKLREKFLISSLFVKNEIPMVYSDIDRSITGSAVPSGKLLKLVASRKEMAAEYFAERRELGIINIGGKGSVTVDGTVFRMNNIDVLYIGRGSKEIFFESENAENPAMYYFVSYPAHTSYPVKQVKLEDAVSVQLGSVEDSNKRTIHKYILPGKVETCQLVMGLTILDKGSVWNTMPAHTHQRRSEVYMYFGLRPESIVVHLIGDPEETRHIIIRDKEAVLSPSWSLHSGAGTQNYSFIWAMGGENQDFDDMDWIPMEKLK